jgi:hypothetical protein
VRTGMHKGIWRGNLKERTDQKTSVWMGIIIKWILNKKDGRM